MSTETSVSPEVTRKHKKSKKNKEGKDGSTKKRKREERQEEKDAAADAQPERRPSKKHRKHEDDSIPAAEPQNSEDELLNSHSPFETRTTSFYLPLSPCAYDFPLEGLCAEHISPLLLTYFPPLNGVLLSYSNVRLSEDPADATKVDNSDAAKKVLSRSIDEYAVSFVWLTAEFLTFRPRKGAYLEGYVSLQNESMLGLVCYNYFNAVIERDKLPKDWKWIEDADPAEGLKNGLVQGGGHFVDGDGKPLEGRIVFRVEDFEASPGSEAGAGTVSILGTLLSGS